MGHDIRDGHEKGEHTIPAIMPTTVTNADPGLVAEHPQEANQAVCVATRVWKIKWMATWCEGSAIVTKSYMRLWETWVKSPLARWWSAWPEGSHRLP